MGQIDLQSKFRSLVDVVRDVLLQFETDPNFLQERCQMFEIELASSKLGIDRLEQSVESTTLLAQAFLNWILQQRQNEATNLQSALPVASIELPPGDSVGYQQQTVEVELQPPTFSTQQDVLVAIASYGEHVEFSLGNVLQEIPDDTVEPRPRSCTICFKEFTDSSKLKKHMSLSHASAKLHRCRACSERFSSLRALKVHFRKEHPGSAQKEEFEVYVVDDQLHVDIQQQELQQCQELWQQNLLCSVCGKKFPTPRRLKYHQKIHQEVNPYQCKICGKEFKVPKYLREHERTHSEEKPYVCKYCGRHFKSWGSRYCHYKVHRDNKKYSCEHCDKTFIRSDGLKRHLIVHTKNKPFSCEYCRKPFTLRNSLMAHVDKYHSQGCKNEETVETVSPKEMTHEA